MPRIGVGNAFADDTATAGLFADASRGELRTVIHERLRLDQAVLAHQKMDAGEVFGRVVLTPS